MRLTLTIECNLEMEAPQNLDSLNVLAAKLGTVLGASLVCEHCAVEVSPVGPLWMQAKMSSVRLVDQ